jgi:hypothetical protein
MAHDGSREPTQLWEALVEFCEGNGYFKTRRFGDAGATKTMISRLSAALKAIFGLHERPFQYCPGAGWKARFLARPNLPGDLHGDSWGGDDDEVDSA